MKIKENKQYVVRKWVGIVLPFYLFTFLPLSAQEAQDPPAPWDGSISEFLEEDMDNNIFIYTPADLAAIHNLWGNYKDDDHAYAGYTILLMNDLDMNYQNFHGLTIGWHDNHVFRGTFDGQGHTIRNLKIEGKDDNRGLFGWISGGTVKNLKLENPDIRAGHDDGHVGAICGRMSGGSTISNCAVIGGTVSAWDTDDDKEVGSICGYVTNGHNTIEYCYSSATVKGDTQIGGIAGKIEQGDDHTSGIYHCYFTGTIQHGDEYFGAICGERYGQPMINNFFLDRQDGVRGTGNKESHDGSSYHPDVEIKACTEEELRQPFLFGTTNAEYSHMTDPYVYTLGYPELKVFMRYNVGDSYYTTNVGRMGENVADSIGGYLRIVSNEKNSFTVALEKMSGATANSDVTINETVIPYFNKNKPASIVGLGANVFENLGVVNSVTIPALVDSVAVPQRHQVQNAFALAEGSSSGAVKDGGLYDKSRQCFLTAPKTFETLTIHQEFADSIADYAFENMGNLKTLYVDTFVEAGTLVDDKDNKAPTIDLKGEHIFDGCSPDLDVYIKDGTTNQLIYGHKGPDGYGFTNADGWKKFYSDYQDVENHMFSYFPINRDATGLATLMLGYPVELPEGVKAWWANTISDKTLYVQPLGTQLLPALTPVLLTYEGTGPLYLSRYEGGDSGAATDYGNNLFKGSVDPSGHKMTSSELMSNFFTLDKGNDNLMGFYQFHPKDNTLPSYIAWLALSDIPGGNELLISFDGKPTGIETMFDGGGQSPEVWFDLQGRKLNGKPSLPGLYIVNGKKIMVR